MSQKHKLEVCANLEEVRQLGSWVATRIGTRLTATQVKLIMPSVELAVQELAVNIVTHGYEASESGRIALEVRTTTEYVDLYFTDTGAEYDPEAVAPPSIEDFQIGGYGVMIIKNLTTNFDVERTNGTNYTHLRFDVPSAEM